MARSDSFQKQHQDILALAKQIAQRLNPAQLSTDNNLTREVSRLLANLSGTLYFHLTMEDKILYPHLLGIDKDGVAEVAQKYLTEIGGLAKVYEQYNKKWSSREAIQANAAQFCTETKGLFEALNKRIEREEAELYRMYDAAA